jgi:asparagine synthase (glutamine-hydrolysing)
MCGIVGTLAFQDSSFRVTEPYIVKMRDTMIHRGPDGAGLWLSPDQKVGLGHRRLSIIDLAETASQPMSNDDGTICLVFNGEIYNHEEIRKELERIGSYYWKTDHSDTEMVLHAFEQWGIGCLERFRGMFALAIWDGCNQELWLIRDRIGIKPLYYSIHNGRIIFASEIKALLKDPAQKREINEDGFFNYLSFRTVPAPDTLFQGIHKLPGGTWMCVKTDGQIKEHKYWDVLDNTWSMEGLSEDDIAKQILDELSTSVKLRKVSDVPVGVFLSGGIDSSINAALFSEDNSEPVKTFSIGYDGEYESYTNELKYARSVAMKVNAIYHEKILTLSDLITFLPTMIHLQDEPIADPVCVPLFYVSKAARENDVIVCQVGEGADELFWGYPRWKTSLRMQTLSDLPIPRSLRKCVVWALSLAGFNNDWRYEYLQRSSKGLPIFWGGSEAFTHAQKMRLLSSRMRSKYLERTSWEVLVPIREQFEKKMEKKSDLNWMTYLDLNLRLPELLLMRVDKMSMGVSLECRVPFLDHKLVELAMSIPSELKTKDGQFKYMLKKAVRGVIPNEIIERKKQGFSAPIKEWSHGQLSVVAEKELKVFCENTDLLDWCEVSRLLKSDKKDTAWTLLNVAQWWNHYSVV